MGLKGCWVQGDACSLGAGREGGVGAYCVGYTSSRAMSLHGPKDTSPWGWGHPLQIWGGCGVLGL